MKLIVLGKYGPYPAAGGGTSAYLLKTEKTTVAFEFGSGAYSRLANVTDVNGLSALVLSHFHFDHVSDAGELGYAVQRFVASGKMSNPLPLYCPVTDAPLALAVKNSSAFSVNEVKNGDEIVIGDITFKFYAVNHPVPCLGFVATDGKSKFAYGGDSNECSALDELLSGVDTALLDGGFLEEDWSERKPHLSVRRCAEYAKKHSLKVIITHINPEYDEKSILAEAKSVYERCEIAEEGKIYEI